MTAEIVGTIIMNMDVVKAKIKPWIDKIGNPRYYINDLEYMIDRYREYTGIELHGYYDWEECRANGARVRQCIEANILPKTKVFIDEDGHVHIYGYGAVGKGVQIGIPELIENAVNYRFGYCTEEERQKRVKYIGKFAFNVKVGDTVEIVDGRKEVGKIFVVTKITEYQYNQYCDPSVYLYDNDGFKVQAHHCKIKDVGYGY